MSSKKKAATSKPSNVTTSTTPTPPPVVPAENTKEGDNGSDGNGTPTPPPVENTSATALVTNDTNGAEKSKDLDASNEASSMMFMPQETEANNPVFVTREIDGVEKKFKIGGVHFHINGIDMTASDLAANDALIDEMLTRKSGILQEVFE